jgi:hypothetical protein
MAAMPTLKVVYFALALAGLAQWMPGFVSRERA